MSDETDGMKEALRARRRAAVQRCKQGLSTGSTLINLACSGSPNWGLAKGHYYFLVGDSRSGKSFLSLTCFAEAVNNPHYDDYRLIYDNAEDGALMDFQRFFGRKVAERVEAPSLTAGGEPHYSSTVEEFYYHLDDACGSGKPFVYVLDSMDSLSSMDEGKKFEQHKKAHTRRAKKEEDGEEGVDGEEKEKEPSGSYGTSKAKLNSTYVRMAHNNLVKTGSILIIISQTRDKIGTFTFQTKTRGGGHALTFYATLELWSSISGKITKQVRGKTRQLGITCKVKVEKNRLTGRESSVEVPIYWSYGLDDLGSCVDYLLTEKHWTKKGPRVSAPEFTFTGTKEELIEKLEQEGLEKDLRRITGEVWHEVEEACALKRKPRYEQ